MQKYHVTAASLALVLALAGCNDGASTTEATAPADEAAASEDFGPPPPPDAVAASEDVLVPGTEYSAITILSCGFDGAPPTQQCNAGIKRNWGEPGEHLIEVSKPDGRKRAIFFRGTEPYGADSAQSDGSAAWELKWTRKDDQTTVTFGPETYVIVDAMITGG